MMQVNVKLTLEQANVVNHALVTLLKQVRSVANLRQATAEEQLECHRQVMEVEQTMRALGLTVPEPPKTPVGE